MPTRKTTKDCVLEAVETLFAHDEVSHIHACEDQQDICVVFKDDTFEYLDLPIEITDWDDEVQHPVQTKWRPAKLEDLLIDGVIKARFTDTPPPSRGAIYVAWHESELGGYAANSNYPWRDQSGMQWKYCEIESA